MTVYFGGREVSVPCTTSATHSLPQRAFHAGTDEQEHDECGTTRNKLGNLQDG